MGKTDISDEELIRRYKEGNDDAFVIILERYKNLVRKKASVLYIAGGEKEDLIQEGMIGLYKAVRNFDDTKEASFATYASMCINHAMCTAISAANRKKHEPLNASVSYDVPVINDEGDEISMESLLSDNNKTNPEYRFVDETTVENLINTIMDKLSPYEKKVLALYMEGDKYTDIARKLGKPAKSIDNALGRIKQKVLSGCFTDYM